MKIEDAIDYIIDEAKDSGNNISSFNGCAINITKSNKKSLTVWFSRTGQNKIVIPIESDDWDFISDLCDTLISRFGYKSKGI